MTDTAQLAQWHKDAYELGKEHGRNAGSWAADGNTSQEHIRKVLRMLSEGDPEAYDYLPTYPNLSGEWAARITERESRDHDPELFGAGAYEDAEIMDDLCEAYEQGVSETFEAECEKTLRGFLADDGAEGGDA